MNDEALKALWQNQSAGESEVKLNAEKMLLALNQKLEILEKRLTKRDRRETIAGYAVALVFGGLAFSTPGVFTKIGAIIVALGALFIVFKLKRAKQAEADFRDETPNLKNWLLQETAKVETQIALLSSVWKWYVSPIAIGLLFFQIGQPNQPPALMVGSSVFVLALGAVIIFLNSRAVKNYLEPLRRDLQEKLALLEKAE